MLKPHEYDRIKKRYWNWLIANWRRIEEYRQLSDDVESGGRIHPKYGAGTTRYTDVTQFTRAFERYLDTPDAIRNVARAVATVERTNPKDLLLLQLVIRGYSNEELGKVVGGEKTRVQIKKQRVFEYVFAQLPEKFTRPLREVGLVDSGSERRYEQDRWNKRTSEPPSHMEAIEEQLRQLYQPDFAPWMLRLDDAPEQGQSPDSGDFERIWPASTEQGRRIRRFGYFLTKYKRRRELNSYRDALSELEFIE